MLYQVEIMFWEFGEPIEKQIELDIPVDNLLELEFSKAEEIIYQYYLEETDWMYFNVDVLNYWID